MAGSASQTGDRDADRKMMRSRWGRMRLRLRFSVSRERDVAGWNRPLRECYDSTFSKNSRPGHEQPCSLRRHGFRLWQIDTTDTPAAYDRIHLQTENQRCAVLSQLRPFKTRLTSSLSQKCDR